MKNVLKYIAIAAVVLVAASSCEKFLDRPAKDSYNSQNFYQDEQQCIQGVNYLYNSPWYDFIRGFYRVGECFSGNYYMGSSPYLQFTVNGSDKELRDMSSSLWAVNAHATTVYNRLKEVQGVDYAIMVSHIGYSSYEPTEPNDTLIIGHSHYIDMVISSHSHTTIKPGGGWDRIANADGKMIPIGQNGKSGKLVATYDLDLETGDIVYSHIPVDASWDEAASRYTAMNSWLDNYRHGVDSIMNNPVATSARYMRNSSATIQNWVSDAAMEIIKALSGISNIDCAIMNKGGIRCDMPQGTVTEGVIGSMFPFDNRFVVLEMPGTELIESMKLMCGRGGDAVSKELRATYNKKGEMTGATVKGKKIDPNKTYIVATIDYLANGGDYMTPMTRCKRLFVDVQKYGNHILDYVKRLEAQGKMIDAKDEVRIKQK